MFDNDKKRRVSGSWESKSYIRPSEGVSVFEV